MQRYYPIMVSVEHSRCVVVGGGAVGERRTGGLLEAGADILLVCPEIVSARLRQWKEAGAIRHLPKPFSPDDLEGAALVIAATGADELNGWICDEAKRRGIPANSASDGSRGSFIVPAVVRRGGLLLTVGTSGAGPAWSARIASELRERYGPEYAELTRKLGILRRRVLAEVADASERRRLMQVAVTDRAVEAWSSMAELPEAEALVAMLRKWADAKHAENAENSENAN
ncbi:precorrin-2 dehydrogenase / sirohydrochlorin ferrochelatase [Cohnella sp. OV330]|uniref:precorrin-2 dehydrogenase/sirohydrochlorin ferrochelatase family protein n=1 Tax=Cohnella sp. OV330 TaxID=1855288 RepID=UPI0008EB4A9B|nr:bifunctional precorrin-2 dehydrogenase/sirohydrochlorin ferrochelatase [Cohnella sp. OV330]SFB40157.1 precorrin-2 dehydrogenase / sirohydrochlorin ferrochelatase [Cohnella sp. OV330]